MKRFDPEDIWKFRCASEPNLLLIQCAMLGQFGPKYRNRRFVKFVVHLGTITSQSI
jgi:hypothetical protein